ncbi:hypothetical protein ACNOYE_17815 [Nannocystaceae bacterium ST9]
MTKLGGGTIGSMATVLHNRQYDFTVVHLTNVLGNGMEDFADPLMVPPSGWGSSPIGIAFPCDDDLTTMKNECSVFNSTPY